MAGLYGAIEAGGTKIICAVGEGIDCLVQHRFKTEDPTATVNNIAAFFAPYLPQLKAIGVGMFGPLVVNPAAPDYGTVTTTPKAGWAQTPFLALLQAQLPVPIVIDTDVNAAVLGEVRYGAAQGLSDVVYFTVGTGIGAGVLSGGELVHGLGHPEAGHMLIPKHPDDSYSGHCPFHGGQCLEGLASGPAMQDRWGKAAGELVDNPIAWDFQAYYLAAAAVNMTMALSPQRMVFGGGVMQQPGLIDTLRQQFTLRLNGYLQLPDYVANVDEYIVLAGLGQQAGICGAWSLAHNASESSL